MLRTIFCCLSVFALGLPATIVAADDAEKKAPEAAQADKPADGEKKPAGAKTAEEKEKIKAEKAAKKAADAAKKPAGEKPAGQKKMKAAGGVVKSVDAAAKTITITKTNKKKQTSEDTTFTVADDAKITLDGESKTLADVAAGANAKLTLAEDGQKVIAVTVGKAKKEGAKQKKPAEKKPAGEKKGEEQKPADKAAN